MAVAIEYIQAAAELRTDAIGPIISNFEIAERNIDLSIKLQELFIHIGRLNFGFEVILSMTGNGITLYCWYASHF